MKIKIAAFLALVGLSVMVRPVLAGISPDEIDTYESLCSPSVSSAAKFFGNDWLENNQADPNVQHFIATGSDSLLVKDRYRGRYYISYNHLLTPEECQEMYTGTLGSVPAYVQLFIDPLLAQHQQDVSVPSQTGQVIVHSTAPEQSTVIRQCVEKPGGWNEIEYYEQNTWYFQTWGRLMTLEERDAWRCGWPL